MAHKNKTNISPYKVRHKSKQGQHRKPEQIYTVGEASDRMADIFRNHGLTDLSHETRNQLAQFYRILMENQETENFTRLLNLRDVAIKHFIDCLIVPKLLKEKGLDLSFPLLDMGTGPGFPGIPLKFIYPEQTIILAEGVQRRVEFLKRVREEMLLKNLPIIGRNINPFFAYPVQGVITRAVEDVRNTLKNVLTCVQTGGRVFLMKGPNVDPEIPVAKTEMGEFYKLELDLHYDLPHTPHQRRLLVYKKIKMGPLVDFEEEPWPGEDTPGGADA
jgi:16S rRNA (guanine527-N7)-methyltransferase